MKNPDANARIHQFGIATTQQNTAKAYVYRYDDVKGETEWAKPSKNSDNMSTKNGQVFSSIQVSLDRFFFRAVIRTSKQKRVKRKETESLKGV